MGLDQLPLWGQIVAFMIGLLLLLKGADWLVVHATLLAKRMGISDLVIGLTIVAIGTSAPEFAVSGFASYQGSGAISLGNVLGSNVFNLGFILALCALIRTLPIQKTVLYRDMVVLFVATVLLAIFTLWDGEISRGEGGVLLGSLVGYLLYLLKTSKGDAPIEMEALEAGDEQQGVVKTLLFIGLGLFCLLLGSRMMVEVAVHLASSLGVSEWLIGITIVAIGTSLPELATSVTSVWKNNAELGVGSLVGSDIFNILGVMGLAALIQPVSPGAASSEQFVILSSTILVLGIMMRYGFQLGRLKGGVLLLISLARYAYELI